MPSIFMIYPEHRELSVISDDIVDYVVAALVTVMDSLFIHGVCKDAVR